MYKKVPQQVCRKCKKKYDQGDAVCPHCGHTNWGMNIGLIIAGLILVLLAIFFTIHSIDSNGIVMNKLAFFLSILGGFLGVIILFGGLIAVIKGLRIRILLKKGVNHRR
jgi:hypothetical protein